MQCCPYCATCVLPPVGCPCLRSQRREYLPGVRSESAGRLGVPSGLLGVKPGTLALVLLDARQMHLDARAQVLNRLFQAVAGDSQAG
jgi:hypothetical protein